MPDHEWPAGRMTAPVNLDVLQVERRDFTDLVPTDRPRVQGLRGFDPIYTDIVDYNIRCTHRIWDERDIGLIYSHYTHNTDRGRQDSVVQRMLQYQVEGIVIASAKLSSNLARECAKTGTPVVLFNRTVPSLPASSVTSDNLEGGRQIAHLLARAGHHRITFIAGQEDSSTSRDREAGFDKGLAECGTTIFARAVGGYTREGTAQAIHALFNRTQHPDAVFVVNDHMAFVAMDLLRVHYRLRIPEDVSVVG